LLFLPIKLLEQFVELRDQLINVALPPDTALPPLRHAGAQQYP
jgi:hypothetical protein